MINCMHLQNCKPMRKTSSTNYANEQDLHGYCSASYTLSLISGRWKMTILVQLNEGAKRFSELKANIPLITERMLSLQLKELERDGLLDIQSAEGQKHISLYGLSALGKSIQKVIHTMADWGIENKVSFDL